MKTQSSNQSRMFRSIVLMGSGLALGCGGKAGVDAEGPAGRAGAGGGTSAGGSTAVAGSPATAGSFAAGGASAGGATAVGAGSGGISSGAGAAGSLDCPPQQWTCSAFECDENGWSTANCVCDSSRPTKVEDCKAGESFVCKAAASAAKAVECACVPASDTCSQRCRQAFERYADYYQCDDESQSDTTLCGCAIVLLK